MPPALSAQERARITRLIMDNGQRLFTKQGLRKTSLEDLVASAEIAKSSFYLFFDSKEALYLELMLAQMAEVKHNVIDQALLAEPDTRAGLKRFLHATIAELATNPLYSRLMTHPEEMEAVTRKLDPTRVTAAPIFADRCLDLRNAVQRRPLHRPTQDFVEPPQLLIRADASRDLA